jgi:hypothetical protein
VDPASETTKGFGPLAWLQRCPLPGRTGLAAPVVVLLGVIPATAQGPRVVPKEEILEAMDHCQGYALTATANGPRLQADVVLRLVRQAATSDPRRRPLFLGHEDWFQAFLERNRLTAEEAPVYARLPYLIGQDMVVDYRWDSVIDEVVRGPKPTIVANVRLFWPEVANRDSFSYDDLRSDPTLRVTLEREVRYRLLDYGDQRWYAEVSGLHGRPTSGPLGLLFDLIGEARVLETRSAVSSDGLQVARARGRKLLITRTATATIWPDGHARKGIPEDRPDLKEIEERLTEPLEIRFVPLEPGDD